MRLIDARGSYTINSNDYTGYSLAFGGGIISVADEWGHIVAEFDADDAPTIDAVPVVRCKECMRGCKSKLDKDAVWCSWFVVETRPDGFCSYGERKDGDT